MVEKDGGPAIISKNDERADQGFFQRVESRLRLVAKFNVDFIVLVELNFVSEELHSQDREDENPEQH